VLGFVKMLMMDTALIKAVVVAREKVKVAKVERSSLVWTKRECSAYKRAKGLGNKCRDPENERRDWEIAAGTQ
jgi:hypothetical protein